MEQELELLNQMLYQQLHNTMLKNKGMFVGMNIPQKHELKRYSKNPGPLLSGIFLSE